jgi:hypothetical protein
VVKALMTVTAGQGEPKRITGECGDYRGHGGDD